MRTRTSSPDGPKWGWTVQKIGRTVDHLNSFSLDGPRRLDGPSGPLGALVLLGLQDQLSRIEEDLEALEKKVRDVNVPDVHNGSFRQETQRDREALMCQAQRLLREYSQSWHFYFFSSITFF